MLWSDFIYLTSSHFYIYFQFDYNVESDIIIPIKFITGSHFKYLSTTRNTTYVIVPVLKDTKFTSIPCIIRTFTK